MLGYKDATVTVPPVPLATELIAQVGLDVYPDPGQVNVYVRVVPVKVAVLGLEAPAIAVAAVVIFTSTAAPVPAPPLKVAVGP